MAPMPEMLQWKDKGKTGYGDKEWALPSMSETGWNTWSSAWG